MSKYRVSTIEEFRRGNCIEYNKEIYRVVNIIGNRLLIKNKAGQDVEEEFSSMFPAIITVEILTGLKIGLSGNKYSKRLPVPYQGEHKFIFENIKEK